MILSSLKNTHYSIKVFFSVTTDKQNISWKQNTQVVLYELPTIRYQQPQRNISGR